MSSHIALEVDAQPLDVAFHPAENIVACGTIEGHVVAYGLNATRRYGQDDAPRDPLVSLQVHKKSCRSIAFSPAGSRLYSVSKDKSLRAVDTQTASVVLKHREAHGNAINRVISVTENSVATGDESGIVKLWDTRTAKAVAELKCWHDNEDYISDMKFVADQRTLLVAGGDGFLSVFDIRKTNLVARSDNMESELLCLDVIKSGKKVICGDQDGVLGIFTWGDWGDVRDRFPGHPSSVDTLCKMTEDLIFTGSNDGFIRLINIQPHEMVGVVGDHGEYPIEKITLNSERNTLASCSHDSTIRLWDVSYVLDPPSSDNNDAVDESDREVEEVQKEESNAESSSDDEPQPKKRHKKCKTKLSAPVAKKATNSFFAGLEDNDDE